MHSPPRLQEEFSRASAMVEDLRDNRTEEMARTARRHPKGVAESSLNAETSRVSLEKPSSARAKKWPIESHR